MRHVLNLDREERVIKMSFGTDLSREFRALTTPGSSTREIDLFRNLIAAMQKISSYPVAEIHGNKYQVTYTETKGWFSKTPPRCELGDVCIIAYSKRKKEARIVIVQNKVARAAKRHLSHDGRKINVSLVQHELLSVRPIFQYVHGGGQSHLIHTNAYPSVCIYGNFFQDSTGQIDMASITAECLDVSHLTTKRTGKHPGAMLYYRDLFESYSCRGPGLDFIAAGNLVDFGDLLADMYIGRPLNFRQQHRIVDSLRKIFLSDPELASDNFSAVLQDFQETELSDSGSFEADEYFNNESGFSQIDDNPLNNCKSLLLLNVDGNHLINPEPQQYLLERNA
jgi:hypothetical protein